MPEDEDVSSRRPDALLPTAFVFAVVIVGANWVGARLSNQDLPPLWGTAVRFALLSAILFAILIGALAVIRHSPGAA